MPTLAHALADATAATDQRWPAEWLRGVLELCALAVLADGAGHGYAVAQQLEAAGLGSVKGGTLYPLLARLEGAGLVRAEWRAGQGGPGRKVFELTPAGHADLVRRTKLWRDFTALTGRVLPADTSTPTTPSSP